MHIFTESVGSGKPRKGQVRSHEYQKLVALAIHYTSPNVILSFCYADCMTVCVKLYIYFLGKFIISLHGSFHGLFIYTWSKSLD